MQSEFLVDDYRRPEASEHYERATELERAGHISEALAEYRRAVDLDPGFSAAHEALGYHYQRRGLLVKALDAFRTVARLENHPNAYFNLGYILVDLERYDEALDAFRHCLDLAPDDPAALYETAYVYYLQGHLREALEILHAAPESFVRDWQVQNLVGTCYLALEDWPAAEAHYLQALEMATSGEEGDESRVGLLISRRYQEFAPGTPLGLKDRIYADAGLALLGTAGDDGLHIVSPEHLILSSAAAAVTMGRLQRLVQALDLGLTAIVPVGRASASLATALSQVLGLPCRRLSELAPPERPLLVLLAARRPELLQVAMEQAPAGARSFVLALQWYGESDFFPDIVGVLAGEVTIPGDPPLDEEQRCAAAQALVQAWADAPEEANGPEQVAYYLHHHRRLRLWDGMDKRSR